MKVLVPAITRTAGVAIATSLAKEGCEVIGIDDRALPWNVRSQYVQRCYVVPKPNDSAFVDAVLAIIKKERPDVSLFGGTPLPIIRARAEIEKYTKMLVPDLEAVMAAYDNKKTLEECASLGIPCPRMYTEEEALKLLQKGTGEKIVAKPRLDIGGSRGLHVITSADALQPTIQDIRTKYGDCVIEEFIPGAPGRMRTVNVLFDAQHRLAAYFMTKKIRQWPVSGGLTALAESTNDTTLLAMVMPFFGKWQWQGIAEVEIKIDERDETPKLIEINPRVWSYIGFPVRCGVNFPWIACNVALGEKAPPTDIPSYKTGIQYFNPTYFFKSAISELIHGRNKARSLKNITRELQGKKVNNNIDACDWLFCVTKALKELSEASTPFQSRD